MIADKTIVYPFAVVKTLESGSVFTGDRQLSTTIIQAFKDDGYKNFYPSRDHLIKNAKIVKVGSDIEITGEEVIFMTTGLIDKLRFAKKYELFYEVETHKRWSIANIQTYIKSITHGKLQLEDSQIKLGYSNLWDFIKRKKMYYVDTTVDVICAFHHTYPKYVLKDKKGFYMDGYYQTTLKKPFKFQTNNYRIEEL